MGDAARSRKAELRALLSPIATAQEGALFMVLDGLSDHDPFFSIPFRTKQLLIAGLCATDAGAAGA